MVLTVKLVGNHAFTFTRTKQISTNFRDFPRIGRDMLWSQEGATKSPVPKSVTFVRFIPQLAFKGKKGKIKEVAAYNLKERDALAKLETHAFVVAYWELLKEQYSHKQAEKTEEDEAPEDDPEEKEDTVDHSNSTKTINHEF